MTAPELSHETDRITVAVALGATYLAVVLNIDSLVGKNPTPLTQAFKYLLLVHFGSVAILWTLYLLYKARNLRFSKTTRDLRTSDITVCLVFLAAQALRRGKTIRQMSRADREQWFNHHSQLIHRFYFDEAVSMSSFLPALIFLLLAFRFVPDLLQAWFGWKQLTATILTAVALPVAGLLASLLANIGRFLITGHQ